MNDQDARAAWQELERRLAAVKDGCPEVEIQYFGDDEPAPADEVIGHDE